MPVDSLPFASCAAVTPSDSLDLSPDAKSLYVGTSGNVKVTTVGGETVTFSNVPVGFFPGRVRRIWSTGTTASNIVAVW